MSDGSIALDWTDNAGEMADLDAAVVKDAKGISAVAGGCGIDHISGHTALYVRAYN